MLRHLPGPKEASLLRGSLASILHPHNHRIFTAWADTYGPVFRVRAVWKQVRSRPRPRPACVRACAPRATASPTHAGCTALLCRKRPACVRKRAAAEPGSESPMGLGGAQLVFVTDPRLVAEVFRKSKELDKDWRLLAPFSQARGLRRSLTCPRPG